MTAETAAIFKSVVGNGQDGIGNHQGFVQATAAVESVLFDLVERIAQGQCAVKTAAIVEGILAYIAYRVGYQ